MPTLDQCHQQVVNALEKEGWVVAQKQTKLYSESRQIFIDIRAERAVNGNRRQIILSEVKCFPDRSDTTRELYFKRSQIAPCPSAENVKRYVSRTLKQLGKKD
jgi:hypothetical protein